MLILKMNRSPRERSSISRLHQLLNEYGLLRASLVKNRYRCGKDYCRCARNRRYWHESWLLEQSQNGRLRMKRVPKDLVNQAQSWMKRYREAEKLLEQISNVYWELIERYKK